MIAFSRVSVRGASTVGQSPSASRWRQTLTMASTASSCMGGSGWRLTVALRAGAPTLLFGDRPHRHPAGVVAAPTALKLDHLGTSIDDVHHHAAGPAWGLILGEELSGCGHRRFPRPNMIG
jgi:hypothetical protein